MKPRNQMIRYGVGTALAALAASSHAAGLTLDVTDTVSTITNAVGTLTAIGVATLSVAVLIKLFSWVRRAIS